MEDSLSHTGINGLGAAAHNVKDSMPKYHYKDNRVPTLNNTHITSFELDGYTSTSIENGTSRPYFMEKIPYNRIKE